MEQVTLRRILLPAWAISFALCAAAAHGAPPDKGWYEEFQATGAISGLADQRIAFVDSSYYRPYDERQHERWDTMAKHSNAGNCDKASTYARKILRRYPFAILANLILEDCLSRAGEHDKAAYHGYLGDTLLLILRADGSAKSPNDRIRVITLIEAMDYVNLSGYWPTRIVTDRGSLAHLVIEGESPVDGSKADFYFNDEYLVQRRMRGLQ